MTVPAKRVGARELKTRLGRYLRAVRGGLTIWVTERGEPVAELRPLPRAGGGLAERLERLEALGLVTKGSGEALAELAPLHVAGVPLSDEIERERDDDRLR